MIAFGVCVRSNEYYDRCTVGIAAHGGPDAALITATDVGLTTGYNEILEAAAGMDGLEAVVLVNENTEILDPDFVRKALDAVHEGADVAGVLGGSGGHTLDWRAWTRRHGGIQTENGEIRHDQGSAGVDAVDGTCMVLSPQAVHDLRFDEQAFPGNHGYDIDLCFAAKARGFTINVLDTQVKRHGEIPSDRDLDYRSAVEAFDAKWRDRPTPPGTNWEVRSGNPTHPVAGTKAPDDAPESYYAFERPELVALVPESAARVLDVGCGSGALGAALKRRLPNCEVVGVEYVQSAVDEASTRLDRAIQVDLNAEFQLPFPRGHFDAIICGDVLEHLLNPEKSLSDLLWYLADDGVVVSSIPNVKHWSVMIPALAQDRWEYTDAGLLDRTHVHLFTLKESLAMLDHVGLGRTISAGATMAAFEPDAHLDPLVNAATAYGADAASARTLLNCYQFLLVSGRPDPQT